MQEPLVFIATFKQMDTRRKRREQLLYGNMAWPHQDQFGINGSNQWTQPPQCWRCRIYWHCGRWQPHALDLETLNGRDNLGGLEGLPYSAHPSVTQTGEMQLWYQPGTECNAECLQERSLARLSKSGSPDGGVPLVHDFVMAGQYLVFYSSGAVELLPVLVGLSSYSDSLQWQPSTDSVSRFWPETLSLSWWNRTLVSVAFRQRVCGC